MPRHFVFRVHAFHPQTLISTDQTERKVVVCPALLLMAPYHLAKWFSNSDFWKSVFEGLSETLEFYFQMQFNCLKNGFQKGELKIDFSNFNNLEKYWPTLADYLGISQMLESNFYCHFWAIIKILVNVA